jgi:DNA-binding CsgD family transcriptional regulator/N-acetylneuraminic acid mutarotase
MGNNEMGELSERELEILRLVATGASNKEIAQTLFISSNTVKVHLRNIFNKIGVTSRTEAAMHAVRIGLVMTSTVKVASDDEIPALDLQLQTPTLDVSQSLPRSWLQRWGVILLLAMILAALVIGIMIAQLPIFQGTNQQTPMIVAQPSPTAIPRWKEHAALPTARSALALAVFENQIYAIGGETAEGVTDVVQHYDPKTDQWTDLQAKPLAVSEISAVVLGGKIYVPGGRMESGNISNALEAYDPLTDTWDTYSSMPTTLSKYALVAYEGQIYLFGGWNGNSYVNTVYAYDPGIDEWQTRTPMPTARGLSGAVISGGLIYVLGGTNGNEALAVNEIYTPSRDNGSDNPWHTGPGLPEGRYAMGIASASDLIYVIGGKGKDSHQLSLLELSPTSPDWQALSASIPTTWSYLGTVPLGQYLYVIGGMIENNPTGLNMSYQAIYTVTIPFVR